MFVASIMFKPKCGCSWYLLGNALSRYIVAPIVENTSNKTLVRVYENETHAMLYGYFAISSFAFDCMIPRKKLNSLRHAETAKRPARYTEQEIY